MAAQWSRWRIFLSMMLMIACCFVFRTSLADDYPRDARVDVLHYQHDLRIGDDDDVIQGHTSIFLKARVAGITSLTLDLIGIGDGDTGMRVDRVQVGNSDAVFIHANNRLNITLPTTAAAGGELTVGIDYAGIPADGLIISTNKHGDRTFFADNFPNRARHWFPGIDHPYDKATVTFQVTAPDHYQVIANGLMTEETDTSDGLRLTRYDQTVPISTYLMVIGVAQFAVQHLTPFDGIPMQTWVYPQDRDAGFHDFDVARGPMSFFVEHVGAYPYQKLANVQSRTRYGGMENASAIFYSERMVSGQRRGTGTVVHEIAHQWFGDSVTTADWNHVWLSEGFATYGTHLYNEFAHGRERLHSGMQRDRNSIFRYERRNPDIAIVDEKIAVENILSTLVYQKGGWVLHMLRHEIGDDAFFAGLKKYYQTYRDGNALTDDLKTVMQAVSGKELDWFFEQWVYTPGHPIVEGTWRYDPASKTVIVNLTQSEVHGRLFRFPLDVELGDDTSGSTHTLTIDGASHTFRIPAPQRPTSLEIDPNTWLLADVKLEEQQ